MLQYAILLAALTAVNAELESIQVIMRHGDRAPSFAFPHDNMEILKEYFPRGLSQLTEQGFEQAKELGEWLREEYAMKVDFLKGFDRKQVHVRSSDKDRCIETAMGVMETLFPGERVPIHTHENYKQDLLLKPNSVPCQKAQRLAQADKKRWREIVNVEHADLFNFLSKNTGWNVDASNIEDVYNVLYRKFVNNVPQPEWVTKADHANRTILGRVVELKRQSRMISYDTLEKSKLRTGYLVGQILKNFVGSPRKFTLYASHDATLTSLLYNLGVSRHQLPPYASAVIFELHNVDGRRFVKMMFRDSPLHLPTIMEPCNGLQLCPLEDFQKLVEPRIVKDRDEFELLCENHMEPLPISYQDDEMSSLLTNSPILMGLVSMIDYSMQGGK
ncbi:unnamed protein product [Caenorhabditis bovis]|uniref:Uncharacterized protein n=1 Tax=Caenorhabditis bovis TaxID=2654633 RepID=A0A8S1EVD5_9PELO|nr:unnamed protein product [Caenorhabditis bovis]